MKLIFLLYLVSWLGFLTNAIEEDEELRVQAEQQKQYQRKHEALVTYLTAWVRIHEALVYTIF
jgi:hypothetical protein